MSENSYQQQLRYLALFDNKRTAKHLQPNTDHINYDDNKKQNKRTDNNKNHIERLGEDNVRQGSNHVTQYANPLFNRDGQSGSDHMTQSSKHNKGSYKYSNIGSNPKSSDNQSNLRTDQNNYTPSGSDHVTQSAKPLEKYFVEKLITSSQYSSQLNIPKNLVVAPSPELVPFIKSIFEKSPTDQVTQSVIRDQMKKKDMRKNSARDKKTVSYLVYQFIFLLFNALFGET